MLTPKVGSVFLHAGFALYRVQHVDWDDRHIHVLRLGETGCDINAKTISSGTVKLEFEHGMFHNEKLYACLRHGMMLGIV